MNKAYINEKGAHIHRKKAHTSEKGVRKYRKVRTCGKTRRFIFCTLPKGAKSTQERACIDMGKQHTQVGTEPAQAKEATYPGSNPGQPSKN